jgi:hypothetical protein
VTKGKARRSSKEVAAERQAKEEAKLEKARTKAAGIKRVAEYEMAQADKDAADGTPRAVPKAKPLVRTHSYANVLMGPKSDVEMNDGEVSDGEVLESDFNPENEDIAMTESNTDTESVVLRPRKKTKVVEKVAEEVIGKEVTAKKVKVPKPKVRDAIKAVRLEEEKGPATRKANNEILDLDPTPKPKRTRPAAPATELSDWVIPDQGKLPSWRMPTFSDNESLNAELMAKTRGGGEARGNVGKGKAKANVMGKHDGNDNNKASDQKPADTERVPPKLKR